MRAESKSGTLPIAASYVAQIVINLNANDNVGLIEALRTSPSFCCIHISSFCCAVYLRRVLQHLCLDLICFAAVTINCSICCHGKHMMHVKTSRAVTSQDLTRPACPLHGKPERAETIFA